MRGCGCASLSASLSAVPLSQWALLLSSFGQILSLPGSIQATCCQCPLSPSFLRVYYSLSLSLSGVLLFLVPHLLASGPPKSTLPSGFTYLDGRLGWFLTHSHSLLGIPQGFSSLDLGCGRILLLVWLQCSLFFHTQCQVLLGVLPLNFPGFPSEPIRMGP